MKKTLFDLLRSSSPYILAKQNFSTHAQNSIHIQLPDDSPITRVRVWRPGYFKESVAPKIPNQASEKSEPQRTFIPTSVARAMAAPILKNAQANIGHVSIETKEIYASLWPVDAINLLNKLKPTGGALNQRTGGPLLDEQYEDKPPDHLIDLYTLNIGNIKERLEEFAKSGKNYHIIGRNYYLNDLGTNNCCGLAYDLLVSGGMTKLINQRHFVIENIIVTPNNLAELVLHAKEQEILKLNTPQNKPKY